LAAIFSRRAERFTAGPMQVNRFDAAASAGLGLRDDSSVELHSSPLGTALSFASMVQCTIFMVASQQ
jgi:hypothetical protein